MKRVLIAGMSVLLFAVVCLLGAEGPREWKSGMLLESEKQEVHQGTTETANTEGTIKSKKNNKNADYSETTTTTTS